MMIGIYCNFFIKDNFKKNNTNKVVKLKQKNTNKTMFSNNFE